MTPEPSPVTSEAVYPVSVEEVWAAITDPGKMREWFFESIEDFKPEVGFETAFNVHIEEGRDFLHLWKVTGVRPNQRIEYQWRYEGIPGDLIVSWDLTEREEGTHLLLTAKGIETFDYDDPAFSRESCQGGWDYFIKQSLKQYLDK